MQFSLTDYEMNDTWQYELHPSHLINVATQLTLPCEGQNIENVLLQRDITKENCITCIIVYHSFIKVDQMPYIYLLRVLHSKACVNRFMTSTTCENAWSKLFLTLTGTSSMLAWPSEIMIVCMLMVDTLIACCDRIASAFTTRATKNGANLFLSVTSWKINGF